MQRSSVIIAVVSVVFFACFSSARLHIGEPSGAEAVKRGKEIVEGVGACGFCHGEQSTPTALLSGGQELEDRYGSVIAPNLTPHETGIKDWTTDELVTVLRNSINRDGDAISKDFHFYEWMSDKDVLAVISYLKALPPVKGSHERRSLGFIDRNVAGFSESWRAYSNYVPTIDSKDKQAYGRYLVDFVANCNGCHAEPGGFFSSGDYLGGGAIKEGPTGERYAPGIANDEVDGLGTWSIEDIVLYLRTGRTPDGRIADGRYCPFPFYAQAPESELEAIATYLKSLP